VKFIGTIVLIYGIGLNAAQSYDHKPRVRGPLFAVFTNQGLVRVTQPSDMTLVYKKLCEDARKQLEDAKKKTAEKEIDSWIS